MLSGILILIKEGNVLFNDTLSTFYLLLYGVRPIVKDHTDSAATTWDILFLLAARVPSYAPLTYRIAHTMTFVTPVVDY